MNENNSELPEFRPAPNINFKKINLYQLIKNNLAFFLLAPTLVGGCYQLWQLATIELNFIRFFSVSQAISDGLMVLIGMFFLLFSLLYVGAIIYILPKIKEKDSLKKIAIKILGTFVVFLILIKLNLINKKAILTNEIVIFLILRLSLLSCTIYLIYELGGIIYGLFLKNKHNQTYNDYLHIIFKKYQKRAEKLGIVFAALTMMIITSSIIDLISSFNNHNRIENFNIIEQKIKDSSLIKINPKVIFYNKDFLFINLNLIKSCGCDIDKNCTKENIYNDTNWIEQKYRIIDGKELIDIYK